MTRRDALRRALMAAGAAMLPSQAFASRDLEDMDPPELLRRLRSELAPGGAMREWLNGDRTPAEVIAFLKSLMPVVRELEKVHKEGSRYREFQELAVDPHSIPHQYRATFQAPGGKAMQGHGTIVVHDQDVYFVTARHVIEGTNAATTFRALRRGGQDVDVAAVRLDWSRSREALAKVRRATDVSPLDSLVTVARANAGDRGGKILLFSSEIYGEFDFTLRLAIPMTPALWYLHSVLNRTTGILKDALNTPLSKAPYGLRHQITYFNTVSDICVIGPEDFSDERRPGVVKAQGRSGSDTYSEELEYEGPFVAVSHTKIPGIGRSLLFSERSDSVATLLRLMRAQEAPKVEIGSIPGLTLQPLSKWRTTVTPPARGGH